MGTRSWFRRSGGDAAAETALATPHAYALYDEIARGGMATIRLARELGPEGDARVVAVKELHPQFAHDQDFAAMFRDEMRVSARVNHPNVVPILDLVSDLVSGGGQAMLVMEYVHGESVAQLQTLTRRPFPPAIAATIIVGVLHGLHAAHETKGADGESLRIIHRDVTPQNVVVGIDGRPRLLDFGVARATGRSQTTRAGQIKGKLSYVSPEQLQGRSLDRRVDIYSASVMLWEMLAGRRLFSSRDRQVLEHLILSGPVPPPSTINPMVTPALDQIVLRGLHRDPEQRFATALEVAAAIEELGGILSAAELGAWVEQTWGDGAKARARLVREIETNAAADPAAMVFPRAAAGGGVDGAEAKGSSATWSPPRSSENNVTVNFRRSRPPTPIDLPSPATRDRAEVDEPGQCQQTAAPDVRVPLVARSGLGALGVFGVFGVLGLLGVLGLGSVLIWTAVHPRVRPASLIVGGYGNGRVASGVVVMPVQPLLTMLGPAASGPRAADSDRAGPGPSASAGAGAGAGAGGVDRTAARRARTSHAAGTLPLGPGGVGRTGAPRRASQGQELRGAAHGWVAREGACSPPYSFDASGIKHFKPACL
jgi:serine/threonine-protein kinase